MATVQKRLNSKREASFHVRVRVRGWRALISFNNTGY
jgi:hypothetical protein